MKGGTQCQIKHKNTKAANESGQVYAADMEDLRSRLDELVEISKQILAKLTEL